MGENAKEAIMEAARRTAQSHGYNGLNLREIAAKAGIKAASIYYHFPGKAELGAAIAKRYWEDTSANLEALSAELKDPVKSLQTYPRLFRVALDEDNRMCLCGFMAAEYDDLPEAVKTEVRIFADVNVAWLTRMLSSAHKTGPNPEARASAIFAAVGGAQLMARSREDVTLFDKLISNFIDTGLIPS